MQPMPFPIPPLFITAVKDICAINTFEKLLNILFSEVYCWHFGFKRLLFSATITDMWIYEVLTLFTRWPLVFWSFLHPPLVARDVITPHWNSPPYWNSGQFPIITRLRNSSLVLLGRTSECSHGCAIIHLWELCKAWCKAMQRESRKRRVGIVTPPDARVLMTPRTPSPKRYRKENGDNLEMG